MAIETMDYKTLKKENDCELREIEYATFIKSKDTTYSGGSGFQKLFNYISGNNQSNQKISMTAPVLQSKQDQLSIAFVLPKHMNKKAPLAKGDDVVIETIENKKFVCIKFKGSNYKKMIPLKEKQLRNWANHQQLPLEHTVHLARYNPPFVPGLFRKNELWIFVTQNDEH